LVEARAIRTALKIMLLEFEPDRLPTCQTESGGPFPSIEEMLREDRDR
jgi:hypothetical protein